MLCIIGDDLHDAMTSNMDAEDKTERMTDNTRQLLSSLLFANGIYIQSFPEVINFLEKKKISDELYLRLSESQKHIPWHVYDIMAQTNNIFSASTAKSLQQISESLKTNEENKSKLSVELGLATLRGSLHEMGSIFLKETTKVAADSAIDASGLRSSIAAFILSNQVHI